ncbi:MAG: hypothetical protein ACRBN8_30475 [Nannocystales bacterium]
MTSYTALWGARRPDANAIREIHAVRVTSSGRARQPGMYTRASVRLSCFLALSALVAVPSGVEAAPSVRSRRAKRGPRKVPRHAKKLINGKVHVDPHTGFEFDEWMRKFEFSETPPEIEGKWFDNAYAVSAAEWTLLRKGEKHPIASGTLSPLTKKDGTKRFSVPLRDFLPAWNNSSTEQTYTLQVHSYSGENASSSHVSRVATLVHRPKSAGNGLASENPFTCSAAKHGYERVVMLRVPKVHVYASTNTKYEGADELWFHVLLSGARGGTQPVDVPGGGKYYSVVAPNTYGPFDWKNDDGVSQNPPILWAGRLRHGQSMTLGVLAMENDMEELKKIKNGVIIAMDAIAAIGAATATPVGAAVAAVAEGVATVNRVYVPDIENEDLLGGFGVRFTNRCGRIQMTWVTNENKEDGLSVSKFADSSTLKDIPQSAMNVMFASDPNTLDGFSPGGWAYGDWTYVGEKHEMYWATMGTSASAYSFLLEASTAVPPRRGG